MCCIDLWLKKRGLEEAAASVPLVGVVPPSRGTASGREMDGVSEGTTSSYALNMA